MDADVVMHCLLLQEAAALSRNDCCRLLAAFPSSRDCLAADAREWRRTGLDDRACQALELARDTLAGDRGAPLRTRRARLASLAVSAVTLCDSAYPELLRDIDCPPPFLYLRGNVSALQRPQLAVVGSRRASPLGARAARELAAGIAAAGLGVTSGLALGIDGAAHRGAIDAGGATLAVMATGIDRVYPARHRELADAICENGCLVSEFAPGTLPLRGHFPRRNRLISGLALGTLVVEAALPSGSLITANTALDQGRDVFALPWSIYHGNGRGCLQLLRDGAIQVQTPRDILEALGCAPAANIPDAYDPPGNNLSLQAQRVVAQLESAAVDADSLSASLDLPRTAVVSALTELELAGRVRRCAGGYVRSR